MGLLSLQAMVGFLRFFLFSFSSGGGLGGLFGFFFWEVACDCDGGCCGWWCWSTVMGFVVGC